MGIKSFGSALVALLLVQVAATSCGDDDGGAPQGKDAGPPDAGPDSGPPEKPEPEAGTEAGTPLDAFGAWREMRRYVDMSPDQRLARAEDVIASKDVVRIFEFVRDGIRTYPPSNTNFDGAVTAQRWGVRGTLRGGAGTPREKVELLLWLYDRAGIQAEAVAGRALPNLADGSTILRRDIAPKFELSVPSEAPAAWTEALGLTEPVTPRPIIDQGGARTKALASSLLDLLPGMDATPFSTTVRDIPLVRVDGQYANPLVPSALLGQSYTEETELDPAPPAGEPPRITVKLEGVRANAAFERFTLVEGQFNADDVVGRKLNLSFVPPVATEKLAETRIDSVTNFVPLLSVSGPDTTQADRDRLAKIGSPVSLGGDVYTFDADTDAVTVNGVPLPESGSASAASNVDSVTASVDPATFPEVTVRVSAVDAEGKGVPHLPAGAVTVKEGDAGVSYSIVQNEAPPPRIAVLFDVSTSIPESFRGAPAVALGKSFTSQLYAKYPNAEVRVGTVWFGANWMPGGWANSEVAANAAIDGVATAPGGSELWNALSDAAKEKPTLVVIITDGDASEPATFDDRGNIAAGPPVLALGVGTLNQVGLDAMASVSGGTTANVADATAAIGAALGKIDAENRSDYVIRYRAPVEGPKARTVTVTINGKTVEVPYEVPEAPVAPGALAGLYLTVQMGDRSYTRALAGLALSGSTAQPEITEAMFADVRAMLRGRVTFSVEGAAPSPSIVLSEYLADRLSLEPLFSALKSDDDAAVIAALKQGVVVTPGTLPVATPPLLSQWTKDSLTFETGPRITSLVQKVNLGGPVTRGLDVWPLSSWATVGLPGPAFERTLEATAALAVTEAGLFPARNTMKSLDGVSLTVVEAGAARDQANLTDEQRRAWAFLEDPFVGRYVLAVPHDPGAFWAIEKATGTVIGVLPDGSGGAGGDSCGAFDAANNMIDALSMIGSLAGASVGGWALLAKWEVKYVTIADIVIGGGSLPPGAGDFTNPAASMGCGIIDDALGNAIPGLGTYENIDGALNLGGVDTGAPSVCGGFDSSDICQ